VAAGSAAGAAAGSAGVGTGVISGLASSLLPPRTTAASATTRPTAPSGSRMSRGPEEGGGALAVMSLSGVA
jgi:hypothetical protein